MSRWHLEGSLDETGAVKKIPITRFPFIVGRSKSIDMVVLRSGISREHAEIISRDGRLFIRDLQSTNGTFVNKQRINTEVLLTHNTTLHFAQFEFTLVDSEHKSSDDEMLTVVVNVDEALGLNESYAKGQAANAAPVKKNVPRYQPPKEDEVEKQASEHEPGTKENQAESASKSGATPKSEGIGSGAYADDKVFVQGNWDESNRRLHTRREARWPVLVTMKNQQSIQCVTKDISEVGLALKSPVNIPEHSLIKANISAFYKGKSREITALCIVRHSLITTGGFIVGLQVKSCSNRNSDFMMKFSNRKI